MNILHTTDNDANQRTQKSKKFWGNWVSRSGNRASKNTLDLQVKHAERGGPRGTIQRQQSPPLIS